MQGITRLLLGGIVAMIAAVALGACGGIDKEEAEANIVDAVQEPPDPIADAESADCPDISNDEGSSFTCTVTTSGGEEYEVKGTVSDETYNIESQELIGGATGAEGAQ